MAVAKKKELAARIRTALYYAGNATYDGEHHKMWAVDQMVRALTGCQIVAKSAETADGRVYSYEGQGGSPEYEAFRESNPDWDEGIAP